MKIEWKVRYILDGKKCFQIKLADTEAQAISAVKSSLPKGSLEFKLHSVESRHIKDEEDATVNFLKNMFGIK